MNEKQTLLNAFVDLSPEERNRIVRLLKLDVITPKAREQEQAKVLFTRASQRGLISQLWDQVFPGQPNPLQKK